MSTRTDFNDWPRLRPLVIDALDQAPMQRMAFLSRACAGDEALRRRAESFLRAYERGESVLKPPSTIQELDPLVGQRIGRYTILRLIGCGGMGAVYQARQDQPSRIVALKLMRASAVTKSAQRRFEYESQLLARLHHPGIAQVYEAGTYDPQPAHPLGRIPYFAMEYVPHGVSITRFADIKALGVRERLELFAKVCDAVHHGHQNGVIHRDLKPANILVGDEHKERDEETERRRDEVAPEAARDSEFTSSLRLSVSPSLRSTSDSASLFQPKIIDFGVGRAVDAEAVALTLNTTAGQIVGTLQYLAPERLGPTAGATDSGSNRSASGDVRSDIYALGVTLYELLAGRTPHNLDGVALPEALQTIREVDPPTLGSINRALRGDVEALVGKALERDPHRRYQSAAELATDIRCFLRDEPISAHPHSATYHIRSFARRNRALVWGVAAAFVILTAGIIGVSLALSRSVKMEHQAVAERDRARKIAAFLKTMLASANPMLTESPVTSFDAYVDPFADVYEGQSWIPAASGSKRQYSSAEIMAHAGRLLDTSFTDEPLLRAEIADTLGVTLAKLGQGDAIPMLRQAVAIRREVLGDDHFDTISSCMHVGMALAGAGDPAGGEPYLRGAVESLTRMLGPDDRKTLAATLMLSTTVYHKGAQDEGRTLLGGCLERAERLYGPDDPISLALAQSFTGMLMTNDPQRGLALLQRTIDGLTRVYGTDSIPVADARTMLAAQLRLAGRFEDAELEVVMALRTYRARYGAETTRPQDTERQFFEIHRRQGRFTEAVEDVRSCLLRCRRVFDSGHHHIIRLEDRLARAILEANTGDPADLEEAAILAQHAADTAMLHWGPPDPLTVLYHDTLAETLRVRGRPEEAERLIQRWLRSDGDAMVVLAVFQTHAACLVDLKQFDEAERALKIALSRADEGSAGDPFEPRWREVFETWVRLYEASGRSADAEPYRAKVAAMRAGTMPGAKTETNAPAAAIAPISP